MSGAACGGLCVNYLLKSRGWTINSCRCFILGWLIQSLAGMSVLVSDWARLAPNGTNLGIFKIMLSHFVQIWPNLGPIRHHWEFFCFFCFFLFCFFVEGNVDKALGILSRSILVLFLLPSSYWHIWRQKVATDNNAHMVNINWNSRSRHNTSQEEETSSKVDHLTLAEVHPGLSYFVKCGPDGY